MRDREKGLGVPLSTLRRLRDLAGNLIEIDWPDVETLDRSRIPEMKLLTEFAHKTRRGSLPPCISIGRI
jgi:hypothetical protein